MTRINGRRRRFKNGRALGILNFVINYFVFINETLILGENAGCVIIIVATFLTISLVWAKTKDFL